MTFKAVVSEEHLYQNASHLACSLPLSSLQIRLTLTAPATEKHTTSGNELWLKDVRRELLKSLI